MKVQFEEVEPKNMYCKFRMEMKAWYMQEIFTQKMGRILTTLKLNFGSRISEFGEFFRNFVLDQFWKFHTSLISIIT